MASAIPGRLTSLWVTAGNNTAYTSPSGTATIINYWSLIRSATASLNGAVAVAVLWGPTANLVHMYPPTSIGNGRFIQGGGAFMMGSGGNEAIVISAASSTAFSFYAGGLRYS